MATAYRQITAANSAKLDSLVGGAIVRGQPIQATNAPIQPTDVFTVKLCVDGARPDGTVMDAIDLGSTGRFSPRCSAATMQGLYCWAIYSQSCLSTLLIRWVASKNRSTTSARRMLRCARCVP